MHDNAICHVIQRGNNRQRIFRDDDDYEKLLSIIFKYREKYRFELYHYCLMSNHLHFVMKICKKEDSPRLMQGVFQTYRFYYRAKYRYSGYLYQGRYKSRLITSDGYLLECGRYVERNPLRAKIVNDLLCYKWTSYSYYANGAINDIITQSPLYDTIGRTHEERMSEYQKYV